MPHEFRRLTEKCGTGWYLYIRKWKEKKHGKDVNTIDWQPAQLIAVGGTRLEN
jgi:hypothetical protein